MAASGMAVALTGLTTEGMNLVSLAERLVVVQRQAVITMKSTGEAFPGAEAPIGLARRVTAVGMTMTLTPASDGDFTDRVVSVSEAGGRLSCIVLSMEMKSYLCGFYKLLKRLGVIEVLVSRTVIQSRC